MQEIVHPHGPLQRIAEGLWLLQGTLPPSALPRAMVVWRLPTGGLWIHSPVNLDEATRAELESLGQPEVLVVPNGFHRADAAAWKTRYPEIEVVAPREARAAVEKVLPVDATAETALTPHGIKCLAPSGLKPLELTYRLPLEEGGHVLVITDILFNVREHGPGFMGLIFRYITRSTGFFGITGLGRWLALKDGAAFATWLRGLADEPGLKAVLVAHGEPVLEQPAVRLREAADRV